MSFRAEITMGERYACRAPLRARPILIVGVPGTGGDGTLLS